MSKTSTSFAAKALRVLNAPEYSAEFVAASNELLASAGKPARKPAAPASIKIRLSSVDGYRETKAFRSLAGAQKAAQSHVGKFPTFGSTYAVSDDGIGKIEIVVGATFEQLFPQDEPFAVVTRDEETGKVTALEIEGEPVEPTAEARAVVAEAARPALPDFVPPVVKADPTVRVGGLLFYKAIRSDGVVAARSTTMEFTHAKVHSGISGSEGSNWFGRPDLAQRSKIEGEICPAILITKAEFDAIKRAARSGNPIRQTFNEETRAARDEVPALPAPKTEALSALVPAADAVPTPYEVQQARKAKRAAAKAERPAGEKAPGAAAGSREGRPYDQLAIEMISREGGALRSELRAATGLRGKVQNLPERCARLTGRTLVQEGKGEATRFTFAAE